MASKLLPLVRSVERPNTCCNSQCFIGQEWGTLAWILSLPELMKYWSPPKSRVDGTAPISYACVAGVQRSMSWKALARVTRQKLHSSWNLCHQVTRVRSDIYNAVTYSTQTWMTTLMMIMMRRRRSFRATPLSEDPGENRCPPRLIDSIWTNIDAKAPPIKLKLRNPSWEIHGDPSFPDNPTTKC